MAMVVGPPDFVGAGTNKRGTTWRQLDEAPLRLPEPARP